MSISPSSISVIDFFKVTVPCSVLNSNFNLSLKNLSTACHMNLKGCTLQSLTASRTASCSFIAPGSFRASIPQLCYKNTQIQKCSHERLFFQKCSQTQQLGSFDCHQEAQNSGLTYPFLVLCQRPKQASSSKDLLGKINGLLLLPLFCFQKVEEKYKIVQATKVHSNIFWRRKAMDSGKLDMCSKSPLSEEHLGQMHLIPRFRYDTHRVVGICRSCLNLKWTFSKPLDFRTKCLDVESLSVSERGFVRILSHINTNNPQFVRNSQKVFAFFHEKQCSEPSASRLDHSTAGLLDLSSDQGSCICQVQE